MNTISYCILDSFFKLVGLTYIIWLHELLGFTLLKTYRHHKHEIFITKHNSKLRIIAGCVLTMRRVPIRNPILIADLKSFFK